MNLVEMKEDLEDKRDELNSLIDELKNLELNVGKYEEQYRKALDEQGPIDIGNLHFYPADVLNEMDPVAYSEGLRDFVDSIDIEDTDEYKTLQSEIDDLESEIFDLEEEITAVEESLD